MTHIKSEATIPDSPIARWDARWKTATIGLAVIGTIALRSPILAGLAFLNALLLAGLGRIPMRRLAIRIMIPALAVTPMVVLIPIVNTGDSGATYSPILTSVAILLRVCTIAVIVVILTETTPIWRSLAAGHSLGIPGPLLQTASLTHRYGMQFGGEVARMRRAARTRGFRAGTDIHTYRTLGYSIASLLVRSADRAERTSEAMRCRGFDGQFRPTTEFRTKPADVAGFFLVLIPVVVLVALEFLS